MSDGQMLIFDLLENPEPIADVPAEWSLSRLIKHYQRFKSSEGLSPSFLASIQRHLRYFTDWLKKHRWNPDREKLSDMSTLLLSDYRLWLADNPNIGVSTANHYILHVRMLCIDAPNQCTDTGTGNYMYWNPGAVEHIDYTHMR